MARRPDVHALVAQRDVPGLMDALRFEDASVRRDAAAALGRLGNTTGAHHRVVGPR